MKVLVTGGAGFVGSHIVDRLVDGGHDVRVLDNLHPLSHTRKPDYLNPGAEYRFADIRDPDAAAAAVAGVDAVSHQAAVVGLGKDFGDVGEYVDVNCAGTACLLRALWSAEFIGPLVLAASMVVYGEGLYRCSEHSLQAPRPRRREDLAAGQFDPRCPTCSRPMTPQAVPEDAPVHPKSVYAATKLTQEHLCEVFGAATGAEVISLRYHNVYGPRMPFDTPYAGVAGIFRSSLEQGKPPQVFEDGKQIRDFVHVDDIARANLKALLPEGRPTGAFNVCSGDPHTLKEMAWKLWEGHGRTAPEPQITGTFRTADVRHVFADPRRAAEVLGFRAGVDFDKGMKQFVTDPLRGP